MFMKPKFNKYMFTKKNSFNGFPLIMFTDRVRCMHENAANNKACSLEITNQKYVTLNKFMSGNTDED